jgi:transposase-like protein
MAVKLRDAFIKRCRGRCSPAGERLRADWEQLMAFFSFPREHWPHLRTANFVESPLVTVRLRTDAARGHGRSANAEAFLWKLLLVAERTFRRLNAPELLRAVAAGEPDASHGSQGRTRAA